MRSARRLTAMALIAVALFWGGTSCSSGTQSRPGFLAPLDKVFSGLGGNSQNLGQEAVAKQLGERIGVGSPLLLDQHSAFPPASESFDDFHPIELKLTATDLARPLPPGDYTFAVTGFCTQWSIHCPGQGLPYKLGRIQGRQSHAIGALLTQGTLQGIAPSTLNRLAWRIQAGIPLSQWAPDERELIHQLIPEFENSLEGDYLAQVQSIYDKARAATNLPPYQTMLTKLGPPGQSIIQLQQARAVLGNRTIGAEHLPDMLYQPTGDGLPRILPPEPNAKPSPWAEIKPGVFARFTVIQGNMGHNVFELRITPRAVAHAGSRSPDGTARIRLAFFAGEAAPSEPTPRIGKIALSKVLGLFDETDANGRPIFRGIDAPLIGYSEGRPAQALIVMPELSYAGIRG